MEELVKKLTQLTDLLKAIKKPDAKPMHALPTLPTMKPPAPPSMTPSTAKAPKIGTGEGPNSKKDPKKVAQQIKDGSMSTKTQKVMLKADTQWSSDDVEKADNVAGQKLYHIHDGPHRITSEPLNLDQIKKRHGGVQKLENSGMRLIPHTSQPAKLVKAQSGVPKSNVPPVSPPSTEEKPIFSAKYSHSDPMHTEQVMRFTPKTKNVKSLNDLVPNSDGFEPSRERHHYFDIFHGDQHMGQYRATTEHQEGQEPEISTWGTAMGANQDEKGNKTFFPASDSHMPTFKTFSKLNQLEKLDPKKYKNATTQVHRAIDSAHADHNESNDVDLHYHGGYEHLAPKKKSN